MQHQHPNHQPASSGGVPSFPPPPPPPPTHPPLPPGWEQAKDPASGRPYFANRLTGETSWAPPPYFPPPPPPPAPAMPPQHLSPPFQRQNKNFHHEQMHTFRGAPPVVPAQQLPSQGAYDVPGNSMVVPSNYPQQYPPNQPQRQSQPFNNQQLPAAMPSNHPRQYTTSQAQTDMNISAPQTLITNPHMQQLGQELENTTTHSSSSGLGPSTAISPGLLVPSVRAMIRAECTQKVSKGAPAPKLELEGLSAGVIADLCNVTGELKSRNVDGGDFAGVSESGITENQGEGGEEGGHYYLPLKPFSLPVGSLPPHIEPGRVDIRLHALHTKLGKI